MDNRIEDRVMLKDLIDRYATESDKNNTSVPPLA